MSCMLINNIKKNLVLLHTFHKFCLLFRNIWSVFLFQQRKTNSISIIENWMPEGNFLFFLYIPMLQLFPYVFFFRIWVKKKISIPGQKDFLTIHLRDWYIFAYILYTILKFHNLFNYCNLLSTWKKRTIWKKM